MDIEKLVSKYVKTYLKFRGINYTNRQILMEFVYTTELINIEVYTAIRNYKWCVTVGFKEFEDFVIRYERNKKINKILKNGQTTRG
jgi:hypothetical protein